jgi:hypothetical protein
MFLARDSHEDKFFKMTFPSLWDDFKGNFEEEVLGPINTTHSLFNIGWHGPLVGNDTVKREWLLTRVRAANKRYAGAASKQHGRGHAAHLVLQPVSWRGVSDKSPFGSVNTAAARALHHELDAGLAQVHPAHKGRVLRLGLVEMSVLGGAVSVLQSCVADWGDGVTVGAVADIIASRKNPSSKSNPNKDKVLFGRFALSPELLQAGKPEGSAGSRFAEAAPSKFRRVLLDHAHPQPFVYNQLNNAFLNSVCHHV